MYIDESGDHTYKHTDNLDTRYLGLTGVLILKDYYDKYVRSELEELKRRIFKYDPDDPPILVRSMIKNRKRWFYVLQDEALNKQWEEKLIDFIQGLKRYMQVFTVVIDKKEHSRNYPVRTFDPYAYSLSVLLNRSRGFLVKMHGQADILVESRGKVEDQQIMNAYASLRITGSLYGDGDYYKKAYPVETLTLKRKDTNIAGLQLADIIAFGQKVQTVLENNKPYTRHLSGFTKRLNNAVNPMVNQYGRYLLE
jgi:hypothetical protein